MRMNFKYLFLVMSLSFGVNLNAQFTLRLLHNNDGESKLVPQDVDGRLIGGAAEFKTLLDAIRAASEEPTIFLSSGDNILPGLSFDANEDESREGLPLFDALVLDALNYDAIDIGNHDFDAGPDVLAQLISDQTMNTAPYLSANLDFSGEESLATLAAVGRILPSVILDVEGEQVGVIGLTTRDLANISSPGDVFVGDVLPAAQTEIEKMKEAGVNKIIVISHLQGIDQEIELAGQLTDVDVIIAGGGSELYTNDAASNELSTIGINAAGEYPLSVNDADGATTYIVTTPGEYRYLGNLVMEFDADGVITAIGDDSDVILVADETPDADLVSSVIDPIEAIIANLTEVLATTAVELDGARSSVRTVETNLGNIIADAFIYQAENSGELDASIPLVAMTNGGGIRNSVVVPAGGDITRIETGMMLPFGNGVVVVGPATPSQLKSLLENSVNASPSSTGRFSQIGGMDIVFNPDATAQQNDADNTEILKAGQRIVNVTLHDGTEILRDGVIVNGAPSVFIVTNDFISGGRDGYITFGDLPEVAEVGGDYKVTLEQFLVEGLNGIVTAEDYPAGGEGRITTGVAKTCADVTISSYFLDGNPYEVTGNPVNLRIDGRGAIPFMEPFNATLSQGESICMSVGTEWRIDYSNPRIELSNGAIYNRSGWFTRGGLSSQFVRNTRDAEIVIVYKLVKPADPLGPETIGSEGIVDRLSTYSTGLFDESGAEIVAHDPGMQMLVFTNAEDNSLIFLDIADPETPIKAMELDMSMYGGGINSVAISNGIIAAAVEADVKQDPGSIVFFDMEGTLLNQVTAGALPDMVTFNHAGDMVIAANEGEPNDDYDVDPVGSITIIDISGGIDTPETSHIGFEAYDELQTVLSAQGIRIFGPGASVSQDLEPEYVAVTPDDRYAFVAMQENNAMAKIDLSSNEIVDLFPLGLKDHRSEGNGLDASNRSDGIQIQNWPVFGMYQPDAIRSYVAADGETYVVTANEGDSRDYDGFSEEVRVDDLTLEAANYPTADELQLDENLGRLKTTTATGDINGDGETDFIHSYGARSFSIWDVNCELIWDSGDQFESILAEIATDVFNSTNDDNDSFKNRSDDKGPEPEAIEIMTMGDHIYALVGLERQGGVMIYDVTDPAAPSFITYFNNRRFDLDAEDPRTGDLGVEDIKFIEAADSPNGNPLIITANEVSGTISIFEVGDINGAMAQTAAKPVAVLKNNINQAELEMISATVYPNPVQDITMLNVKASKESTIDLRIVDLAGRAYNLTSDQIIYRGENVLNIDLSQFSSGNYILQGTVDQTTITEVVTKL